MANSLEVMPCPLHHGADPQLSAPTLHRLHPVPGPSPGLWLGQRRLSRLQADFSGMPRGVGQ